MHDSKIPQKALQTVEAYDQHIRRQLSAGFFSFILRRPMHILSIQYFEVQTQHPFGLLPNIIKVSPVDMMVSGSRLMGGEGASWWSGPPELLSSSGEYSDASSSTSDTGKSCNTEKVHLFAHPKQAFVFLFVMA